MEPNCELTSLSGVGPARAALFGKLGIRTPLDLLRHYPRDYEDRSKITSITDLEDGQSACVRAMVAEPPTLSRIRSGLDIVKARAVDGRSAVDLVFFNQSYVAKQLKEGATYTFFGKISVKGTRTQMLNPVFEAEGVSGSTGRIVPVYRLSAGLSQKQVFSLVCRCLDGLADRLDDVIPDGIRRARGLAHIRFALENIHRPCDFETLAVARRRLIFEEFFIFALGLSLLGRRRKLSAGTPMRPVDMSPFWAAVSFEPTGAQTRAVDDAIADMTSGLPMNRLVQGDVGSGKTLVAAACAYFAAQNGYQTAIMAPTNILAEQHYSGLAPLFGSLGIDTALLTGGMPAKLRRDALTRIAGGSAGLVIGTHALLTEGVEFDRLGLVVTDEQHRFGVRQRSILTAKSEGTHTLVMSATPIPRTLALIVYGDLDISVVDQMPPGREPVDTFIVDESKRRRIHAFIRKLVDSGRQVYIVCPLVEDDETGQDKASVLAYAENLRTGVFSDLRIGCVFGQSKDKESVMRSFAGGEIDILVATSVIEVGVDVPNAALIVIENAERFGLSTLHQLRGRVGRGGHKSYCVLFVQTAGEATLERLRVMTRTTDGFRIADEDLRLRGPGDFFGTRQHGLPMLKIASVTEDMQVLSEAREQAAELLGFDPKLEAPEHKGLLERVSINFGDGGSMN